MKAFRSLILVLAFLAAVVGYKAANMPKPGVTAIKMPVAGATQSEPLRTPDPIVVELSKEGGKPTLQPNMKLGKVYYNTPYSGCLESLRALRKRIASNSQAFASNLLVRMAPVAYRQADFTTRDINPATYVIRVYLDDEDKPLTVDVREKLNIKGEESETHITFAYATGEPTDVTRSTDEQCPEPDTKHCVEFCDEVLLRCVNSLCQIESKL